MRHSIRTQPRARLRRSLLAVCAVAATTATLVTVQATGGAQAAVVHTPIVFVHGFLENGSMWSTMKTSLKQSGYQDKDLWAFDYDSNLSNVTTGTLLASYVTNVLAQTGATQVDIVNHSMGGLNSRQYVKFNGGAAKVRNWVSLAGANQGTAISFLCVAITVSCREMIPGSAFLSTLNAAPLLTAGPKYYTFWSMNDGVIIPASNTTLAGATNTMVSPWVFHMTIFKDADVISRVKKIVNV
jgi:triacylglycerol lipase